MTTKPIVLVELSPSGGLFQFAVELGNALAAQGRQVELWTGPRPELGSRQTGFTVRAVLPTWHPADTRVYSRWWRLARRVFRAGQLVLAWMVLVVRLVVARPSAVLWSQWRFAFEPMFAVVASILLPNTVFGMIAHEPLPRSDAKDTSTAKTGPLINRAFGTAWRRLDMAFVLGPKTRDLAIAHWRPTCPVYVVPHGSEQGLRAGRTVAPVSETDPVVLFFGVWSKYKGIEVLLDAFAAVRSELPEARLVLGGAAGADIDVGEIVERAGLIGNVNARPGYVAVEDVPALLEAARVVVIPYTRATQSGVVHLAYTFGRPVIASSVGDLPEAVHNEVTGLLVPPGDADALTAAMLRLLRDPDLAARLGVAGEESLAHAWVAAAEQVCAALDRAVKSDGPR